MNLEYTSSDFIVIPTGNKKKNRKWTNGEETPPHSSTPPTLPSCVYSDCNYFIH